MRYEYNIKEMENVYGKVISEGVEKGFFKHRGEALTLISVFNYCGIGLYDYKKILFLLEKVKEIKNKEYSPNDENYWLSKSDNISIVHHLLKKYYSDDEKEINYSEDEKYKLKVLSLNNYKKNL